MQLSISGVSSKPQDSIFPSPIFSATKQGLYDDIHANGKLNSSLPLLLCLKLLIKYLFVFFFLFNLPLSLLKTAQWHSWMCDVSQ
jgi:hypothetical protein